MAKKWDNDMSSFLSKYKPSKTSGLSHNVNDYSSNDMRILSVKYKEAKPINEVRKSSKEAIKWLNRVEKEMGIKIQKGDITGKGEYSIMGPNGYNISFDGYYQPEMIVFEYHGCRYHNDPRCFPKSDRQVFIKTIEREKYILSKGYKLFRIWSHEFKRFLDGKTQVYGVFVDEADHQRLLDY